MKKIALLLFTFSLLFCPPLLHAQSKKSKAKSNTDPTVSLSGKKRQKVHKKVTKGKGKKKKPKKASKPQGRSDNSHAQLWIREDDLDLI